ncbi:MAG: PTS sugar transporter subunit IIA [Pseudomonadota bacterium]
MNEPTQLLLPETTRARVPAASRKRVLQQMADCLSSRYDDLDCRQVFEALMARERLGSTGLGEGVALPHCRVACADIYCAFFTLDAPVDFEAPDDRQVDLVFALVVPEGEEEAHLAHLARLSGVFSQPEAQARFRASQSDSDLYAEVSAYLQRNAA